MTVVGLNWRAGDIIDALVLNCMANIEAYTHTPAVAYTTTSSSFADLGVALGPTFTKCYDETRILVELMLGFNVSAIPTAAQFGIEVGSLTYPLTQMYRNDTVGNHRTVCGFVPIAGLSAGSLGTLNPRWRRLSGAGTVQVDTADRISIIVRELKQ